MSMRRNLFYKKKTQHAVHINDLVKQTRIIRGCNIEEGVGAGDAQSRYVAQNVARHIASMRGCFWNNKKWMDMLFLLEGI